MSAPGLGLSPDFYIWLFSFEAALHPKDDLKAKRKSFACKSHR